MGFTQQRERDIFDSLTEQEVTSKICVFETKRTDRKLTVARAMRRRPAMATKKNIGVMHSRRNEACDFLEAVKPTEDIFSRRSFVGLKKVLPPSVKKEFRGVQAQREAVMRNFARLVFHGGVQVLLEVLPGEEHRFTIGAIVVLV